MQVLAAPVTVGWVLQVGAIWVRNWLGSRETLSTTATTAATAELVLQPMPVLGLCRIKR